MADELSYIEQYFCAFRHILKVRQNVQSANQRVLVAAVDRAKFYGARDICASADLMERESFVDWVSRHKGVTTILAIVGVLIFIGGMAVWRGRPTVSANTQGAESVYLTADDGKTIFVGPASEASGGSTVQAMMYSCDDNATHFLGYLKRKKSDGKAGPVKVDPAMQPFVSAPNVGDDFEIKKRGDAKWVPMRSAGAAAIFRVSCPDGKGMPVQVAP